MGLGIAIRTLMNARKQSVAQIAAISGMDSQKVYYILKHDPVTGDLQALKKLADNFGVTLDFFLEPNLEQYSGEARLLESFRRAGDAGRQKICAYAGDMELLHMAVGK